MTASPTTKKIIIDSREFLRGMTTSKYTDDGFISADTNVGINLVAVPGAFYLQQSTTFVTPAEGTTGSLIASCSGAGLSGGQDNYYISNANKFYNYKDGVMTLGANGAGVKQYTSPNTDIIFYKESLYATSTVDITQLTLGAAYAITNFGTETWWTVTKGKLALNSLYPHPMLVYEDILWIANAVSLHKWDNTTATENALVLVDNSTITALGIDPGSGKMMIASTQGPNSSGNIPRINKISFWDGVSNKVLRAIIVDDMVTSIYSVGGTVYINYGQKLGYWNGSGITFLRKLKNVLYDSTYLTYKHRITNIDNTLYVIDGKSILAYESLQGGGPKVFYYAWGKPSIDAPLEIISHSQKDQLVIGYKFVSYLAVASISARTVTVGATIDTYFENIRTRWFKFPNKIRIKSIKVSFIDSIPNNTVPIAISAWKDQTSFINFWVSSVSGMSSYELEYIPVAGTLLDMEDFYISIGSGTPYYSAGIRKIVIYYDDVD